MPGARRVSGVVTIDKPLTLTTAGASGNPASCLEYGAPRCAVLRADSNTTPSASGTRGFVRMGTLATPSSAITPDHVLVDGHRDARLASASAAQCAQGNKGDGINIGANCAGCTVVGSASARALCGSGLEWDKNLATITNSVFFGNGDHATQNMWSDGLTIHKSDGATVDHCRFVDDSDVGFHFGGRHQRALHEQLHSAGEPGELRGADGRPFQQRGARRFHRRDAVRKHGGVLGAVPLRDRARPAPLVRVLERGPTLKTAA